MKTNLHEIYRFPSVYAGPNGITRWCEHGGMDKRSLGVLKKPFIGSDRGASIRFRFVHRRIVVKNILFFLSTSEPGKRIFVIGHFGHFYISGGLILLLMPNTTRKLTWNLKMDPSERRFLWETILFRFHVSFQGCI